MEFIKTVIEGLLIIKPDIYHDERGYFFESYNEKKYKEAGIDTHFVQDNESFSCKNTIRGLHYQIGDFAQGKLVRVVSGSIRDYAVDIRLGSSTFGKYVGVELSAENKLQFWIPVGFAHGFIALENKTTINYKCTAFYSKTHERGINFKDNLINIPWNIKNPIISQKDSSYKYLKEINKNNIFKY